MMKNPLSAIQLLGTEYDSCAIFAAISKTADSASIHNHNLWTVGVEALEKMDHRAGWVDGRSDGTGILIDIPRILWSQRLQNRHIDGSAEDPRFWILQVVSSIASQRENVQIIHKVLEVSPFKRLLSHHEITDHEQLLGSHALWYEGGDNTEEIYATLEAFEEAFPGMVASFSNTHIVFKVTEGPDTLGRLLAEQVGTNFYPRVVIGHNRFSTNTATDLSRVQPFLGLAHNGEIDTIDRLQHEMAAYGISPIEQGSDSQNLDRLISALVWQKHLSHAEAIRVAISPSPAVISGLSAAEQKLWREIQAVWGPYAQGPAAIVHRLGNSVVAAVDALGLRPLWVLETREAYILSSEPGITSPEEWMAEPRALGPGEIVAFEWQEGCDTIPIEQNVVIERLAQRLNCHAPLIWTYSGSLTTADYPTWLYRANGWRKDDEQLIQTFAQSHREPIGSLGYDGPLSPFSDTVINISDFLQETVAVVTNPALDRERESEHFSLRTHLGARPNWTYNHGAEDAFPLLSMESPWIHDGELHTLLAHFAQKAVTLPLQIRSADDEVTSSIELGRRAVDAVKRGALLVLLDDREAFSSDHIGLDPALATAAVDRALLQTGLRRSCSIAVRSGMIRNLHDGAVLLGLGASAIDPYLVWSIATPDLLNQTRIIMNQGLEKIISTMGIHELEGYGRVFSAIGLPQAIADMLHIRTFAAAPYDSWSRQRLAEHAERLSLVGGTTRLMNIPRATNHTFKTVAKLAAGVIDAGIFEEEMHQHELKHPIALRQTLAFNMNAALDADALVSIRVGDHALPFVISSMSFGSQGETAFRAYAEAAKHLNMLSMNGEGGEIPDMIGQYYHWRGHQVASGRFGINTTLLNGARYAEIKIGQGAKPGEGGHLPGKKVSVKVAQARSAVPGIDLISPSNNHDLYSIEDLKELIDELKEANPELLVTVKVPVVPNIGTIAVGIVKAGADVINLSGFDGGTGAARTHALRHVGLPADIGLPLTHTALTVAGLRDRVELWVDGGMRSAADVVRMILLGANRVGFGTLTMMALGCTVCRGCQLDTCHVGITTQIESTDEASARGLKRFLPQDLDSAVAQLETLFTALGEGVRQHLRSIGFRSIGEAIGQSQLLEQPMLQGRLGYGTFLRELNELVAQSQIEYALPSMQAAGVMGKAISEPVRLRNSRSIGTHVSGQRIRYQDSESSIHRPVEQVAGQGFGAFLGNGVHLMAHGGAQDGVGKGASGGVIAVMKTPGYKGLFYGGHVGKSMAYGAQGGLFIVQGSADARAGIRLAGADVVILADGLPSPRHALSAWGSSAIKGFGFEYMTRGRALILGDPGPWLASGMTGGVIYLKHSPEDGLDLPYLKSRLASSAKVSIVTLDEHDGPLVREILQPALAALITTGQSLKQRELRKYAENPLQWLVKVVPMAEQVDSSVSTE